jgi:hypothetical protein
LPSKQPDHLPSGSCRRLNIPVRNYFGDILPELANTSIQRIAALAPAWVANHR